MAFDILTDEQREIRDPVRALAQELGSLGIKLAGTEKQNEVFAKTDPAAGHAGISAFVVEANTAGFEVTRLEPKMGISGSTTGELAFTDMRVPGENGKPIAQHQLIAAKLADEETACEAGARRAVPLRTNGRRRQQEIQRLVIAREMPKEVRSAVAVLQ